MPDNNFWLYDWIDTFEIKDVSQAESLLSEPRGRRGLQKRAAAVPFTTETISLSDAPTIIAGRAIDLSGELDCFAWDCMKKQVDKLFSHVWHYFDRIVVVGASARRFAILLDSSENTQAIEQLLTYVRLLLYIREIGAEDLLVFRQKRPPCGVHLEKHLNEIGLNSELMLQDKLVEQIAREAKISTDLHDEHLDYAFVHSEFEHTVWGKVENKSSYSDLELRHVVTKAVIRRYLASLASDVYTAQVLNSPLGSTVNLHGKMLNLFKVGLQEADVAFQLNLPILDDINPSVLLKIRSSERTHFEKFRHSLRTAIKNRLENASSERATEIAEEIRKDVINPALIDIELRLKAAQSAFTKKAGLSITIGAITTTCGLLTANPFLIAAGATPAVGYTIAAGQKLIEEKRDISLSDMYFLWQTQQHSIHK